MVLMTGVETSAWMWKKRNFSASNKQSASERDPRQEQSFAEDSSELLCECIWPPRYYTCSFCRKEFKSAQALGGHMNVHRRDRARLRQSPNSQSEVNQHSGGFLDAHQHPLGVSPLVILSPDSGHDHSSPETDPTPHIRGAPPSAVSSSTTFCCNDASKQALICRHSSYREPPLCDSLLKIAGQFNRSSPGDFKFRNCLNGDVPWQELAIGSPESLLERKISDEEMLGSSDDEAAAKKKRPRICSTGALALCSRETAPSLLLYSDLLGRTQSIVEDLDLELRLGVRSTVN